MRFSLFFLAILSNVAFGSDPCQDLCLSDGDTYCTHGSRLVTDSHGRDICLNYYSFHGVKYIYSPEFLWVKPLLLEDVPLYIGNNALMQSRRLSRVFFKLSPAGKLTFETLLAPQVSGISYKLSWLGGEMTETEALDLWNDFKGPDLLRSLTRMIETDPISARFVTASLSPFAFATEIEFTRGTELDFSTSTGILEFCNRHQQDIAESLSHAFRYNGIGMPDKHYAGLGKVHRFCPQLLDNPLTAGTLLSMDLNGQSGFDRIWRRVRSRNDLFEQSLHELAQRPIKKLQKDTSPQHSVVWTTTMGLRFARDTELYNFSVAGVNKTKCKAFGRFLALLVLNIIPAPLGQLPLQLLETILGISAVERSSNFGLIAKSFHKVIPLGVLREFTIDPPKLQRLLTGKDLSEISDIGSLVSEKLLMAPNGPDLKFLWNELNRLSLRDAAVFMYRVMRVVAIPLDGLRRFDFRLEITASDGATEITSRLDLSGPVIELPFSMLQTPEQLREALLRFIRSGENVDSIFDPIDTIQDVYANMADTTGHGGETQTRSWLSSRNIRGFFSSTLRSFGNRI